MNVKKKIRNLSVGIKIKELRTEKRLTQGELAKLVGGDTRQISFYESNKNTPSTEVVVKLAKAFGVSVDYLLTDDAPRTLTLQIQDKELLEQLEAIDKLNEDTKEAVKLILRAVVIQDQLGDMIKPTLIKQS